MDDKPVVFEKFKPKKKRAPPPPNPFGSDEEESVQDPPSNAEKSSNPSKEQSASTVLNPFEDKDEEVTQLFFSCVLCSCASVLRTLFLPMICQLRPDLPSDPHCSDGSKGRPNDDQDLLKKFLMGIIS